MKPIGAMLYLTYRCPNCGCDWERSVKEARLLNGFVCQNCQHFCKTDTIDYVEIIPHYTNGNQKQKHITKPQIQPKPEAVSLTAVQNDAIMALCSLGFGKKQSKDFVESKNFNNVEDYITEAMKNYAISRGNQAS